MTGNGSVPAVRPPSSQRSRRRRLGVASTSHGSKATTKLRRSTAMKSNHGYDQPHQCNGICVPGVGFHVRTSIIWWAKQMELILQNNDHKGGWLGPEFPIREALRRLREEVDELDWALPVPGEK